jgi:uncharacterized protein YbgA (DUF1722 family)/uncharacterized protein YbbK (DUF523 family)
MAEDIMRIGISSCLLGEEVRYDGGHKLDLYLKETLGSFVEWVPVCPEVECGLPIPREAMHLVGDPESPRLVTVRTGQDYTLQMLRWAENKLKELEEQDLCGFVFKSRSPSSGMKGVKVYSPDGMPKHRGVGIFARTVMEHFPLLPVEDEGRLTDPGLRENFIERVFVFQRWKDFMRTERTIKDLISFHTDHKLLILSHSPKHYRTLGVLVATAKESAPEHLHSEYLGILMEGLRMIATIKKNTNVLQHIMGYFKHRLTPDEKKELIGVIDDYHRGLIPLIVPIVLLRHYVRKYDEPYLKRQHYLNPHPAELMLRNHV